MHTNSFETFLESLQCQAYAPYQTFSTPGSNAFKDIHGMQIATSNTDIDSLFAVGREAYAQIVSTCVPGVLEQYVEHRRGILELQARRKGGLHDDKGEPIFSFPGEEGGESIKFELRYIPSKEVSSQDAYRAIDHLSECFEQIDIALGCIQLASLGAITASVTAVRQLEKATAIYQGAETFKDALRRTASAAARARHDNKDQKLVRGCYENWLESPEIYPSVAVFARDLVRRCETIKDTRTIEKWVRKWRNKSARR